MDSKKKPILKCSNSECLKSIAGDYVEWKEQPYCSKDCAKESALGIFEWELLYVEKPEDSE